MQNVLRLLVLGLLVLGLLVLRLLVLVLGLLVVRLLVLVVSCCWHCMKELLSAEPGSSNTDMIEDEDAAEKPYNDLRVIRRALTAATQTDQMEAAWGHDPRWQVCALCSSPSSPALACRPSCSVACYSHLLMVQSMLCMTFVTSLLCCCMHGTYEMLTSVYSIKMAAFHWLYNMRKKEQTMLALPLGMWLLSWFVSRPVQQVVFIAVITAVTQAAVSDSPHHAEADQYWLS